MASGQSRCPGQLAHNPGTAVKGDPHNQPEARACGPSRNRDPYSLGA